MVITNLQPETAYSITVAAYTMKGDGARSKPKVVVTKGAGTRPLHGPPAPRPSRGVLELLRWAAGTESQGAGAPREGVRPCHVLIPGFPARLAPERWEPLPGLCPFRASPGLFLLPGYPSPGQLHAPRP